MWFRAAFVAVPFVALALAPLAARAQTQRSGAEQRAASEAAVARAKAAFAPVAKIVGQWEGDAQVSRGPGPKLAIRQTEDITWGASGTILMIKGTGRSQDEGSKGAIVFEAAAIAWYDADAGKVRMQTHTDGRSLVVDAELRPDTLIWGFETGGGRVRYTIALSNDTFHEIGEFLRPGAPPIRTIEMTLKRK